MTTTCAAALLLACVALSVSPSRAVADSGTTTDLLWPLPKSVNFGSSVYSIQPSNFQFMATGAGGASDILKEAFKRYIRLIFETPVPFYPSGSSGSPVDVLNVVLVDVVTNNETLGPDTNETCKLLKASVVRMYACEMQLYICR